jgi:hypothetical protein
MHRPHVEVAIDELVDHVARLDPHLVVCDGSNTVQPFAPIPSPAVGFRRLPRSYLLLGRPRRANTSYSGFLDCIFI